MSSVNHSQPCGRGCRPSIEPSGARSRIESDNHLGPFQNDWGGPIRLNTGPGWSVWLVPEILRGMLREPERAAWANELPQYRLDRWPNASKHA